MGTSFLHPLRTNERDEVTRRTYGKRQPSQKQASAPEGKISLCFPDDSVTTVNPSSLGVRDLRGSFPAFHKRYLRITKCLFCLFFLMRELYTDRQAEAPYTSPSRERSKKRKLLRNIQAAPHPRRTTGSYRNDDELRSDDDWMNSIGRPVLSYGPGDGHGRGHYVLPFAYKVWSLPPLEHMDNCLTSQVPEALPPLTGLAQP